jgi:hypothetical protein
MIGTQDKYLNNLKCDTLFTDESKPKVIKYEEAHKFPRAISDEAYSTLKEFVKEQFETKNGETDGYEVDTERYNFEVRFDKQ